MLLPQTKEREYRFRLALRMVLPIFALILALIFHTFITSNEVLNISFYVETLLILLISTYFILYLIYKGFDINISDNVSKTFTREYLYKYIKKEIKAHDEYTLILISIDNLNEINTRYGIKNGDKVLYEVVQWLVEYFKYKDISNFPLGHIKGGDFIIGLRGSKSEYKTVLELMCLKSDDFKIDDIEIQISGSINDTSLSKDINYLIDNLFELQEQNRSSNVHQEINPSELEYFVIDAIKQKNFALSTQDIFFNDKVIMKECFIKLKTPEGKLLHPKSYMKVLDKLRLMLDYDLMILEENIMKCISINGEKYVLSIAPTSIRNPRFIIRVKELFEANPKAKGKIVFILNENEYYPRIDKYNFTLQILRDMGIEIAIDRLGSIHTSFLYLRDLEVDIVRFDSYYSKGTNESKYRAIIDGFNKMAHEKGLKTWMKMLENENVNNLAKELNIDYLQGKYLANLKEINKN